MPDDPTPRISTPLTDLLGIEHPILSAPMGDTAGGALAAAVSAAGGLGFVGGGYSDPEWLRRELPLAGDARLGIGFITFALDKKPEALDVALDAEPVAIQLSFGDPRPYAERIKAANVLLICGAQSPDEIDRAVEVGADVIIAHGRDAGGHGRPQRGTMGLIPATVDQVAPIPVVAAGGIADGRGLAAALMLGATGVSLGTRFLASTEALSNESEAAAIVSGRSADTVRTDAFDVVRGPAWPDGHDGRVVTNGFVEGWERHRDEAASRSLYARSEPEDYSIRPLWAGEGLDLVTSIETPAAIVASIMAQAVTALRSASSTVTS